MLAWEFIYQKNRNSVTYERDDQLLREVKYNKYNKKLKTTVWWFYRTGQLKSFMLGPYYYWSAYYWSGVVLSMAHRQGAHRHNMDNSLPAFD